MRHRPQLPAFYYDEVPSSSRDLATLLPTSLALGERFESIDDACNYSQASAAILSTRKDRLSLKLANNLRRCRNGHIRCGLPSCPICMRQFRRWFAGEALRLLRSEKRRVRVFTVLMDKVGPDQLNEVDPHRVLDRLRKRLLKSGLVEAEIFGGLEAGWKATSPSGWVIHVHFIAIDARRASCERLATQFGRSEFDRPVLVQRLRNAPRQIGYLLKFSAYHRPYKQVGARKSKAYPLPPNRHRELLQWQAAHKPQDFVFLHGLRRFGSRIRRTLR